MDVRQFYANRRTLPKPQHCPTAIYELMKECWELDSYKRKLPQAITRDLNQILYEDYNWRRGPVYEHVLPRNFFASKASSVNSLSSKAASVTDETVEELTQLSDIDNEIPLLGNSREWLTDDLNFYEHNFWMGRSLTPSSLTSGFPSLETLESVVELEDGCNVVLQGRIGQVKKNKTKMYVLALFMLFLGVLWRSLQGHPGKGPQKPNGGN